MRGTKKKALAVLSTLALVTGLLAGCGSDEGQAAEGGVQNISIAIAQVGDVPGKGNEVQQKIEAFTNTKLDIQWIPASAYNDKINVMIASSDMPKIVKVQYNPTVTSAMRNDVFWEIGPLLKDYKNLSAQNERFFNNIKVEGKIYGVPVFSDIARATVIYRKDWFDKLNLKVPTTPDEWYETIKTLATSDPDGDGQDNTFGLMLFKKYNEDQYSFTTRLGVSFGAPNKWKVEDDGSFTPEFMTPEYMQVLDLLKRLYDEKLLNQDFAVFDSTEAEKKYDSGVVGMRVGVAQNGKSQQERLSKNDPDGVVDIAGLLGANGDRVAGQTGNSGILAFPKATVKSEEELKGLLSFLDKLMEPEMATLLMRGIEDKHYTKVGEDEVEMSDFDAFQREVKPYRDNLPYVEGYNVPKLKDTELGVKGTELAKELAEHAVPNPALTLYSPTYGDRGADLDQMIADAQTKYIMGKIDENGWKQEIENWANAGGTKIREEYAEDYKKQAQ
ncbi:extracellular solute-binding protein [Paenibacillus illinoisensis]|uniref:extracellular solute-binding protein n=1 Tax=Paenibacillus illinoisensis TaxID=59845 RepID=UPI0034BFFF3A